MGTAAPGKRNPFRQASQGVQDALGDARERARWIALDLETTRFSVLVANAALGRSRLGLCFDHEHPQVSAASRALLGPAASQLIGHSLRSTTPCAWRQTPESAGSAILQRIDTPILGTCGIAFPVATSGGQSGLVVFIGNRTTPDERHLLDIHTRCFQLFEVASELASAASSAVSVASRERDCLDLSSHGLTSDEIGVELELSPYTVNQYLTNTARKLGADNRVHAVAKALRLGLIS